jgi:TIR domain
MSSLADLPKVTGFFSYCREDDEAFEGTLSALRRGIQSELSAQLGRSETNFRLWQDQEAIAPGKLWKAEITAAVEQSVFFIPIVTPRSVSSHYCKFEFETFLARERALGRTDLVFPLLYIRVPALENEGQWRGNPVLSVIGSRQYIDWKDLRHLDVRETVVRKQIERFCDKIVETLREPWVQLTKEENVARALESQLQNIREETATLIKKKLEDMDLDRRKGGLREDDFAFLSRSWEISFLDRAREEIMNLIVEGDIEQANLATQRDKVYRKLSEPGQKQEYDRLKSMTEDIEPRRERLKQELDSYDNQRDRLQELLKADNKRRYSSIQIFPKNQ